MGCHTKQQLPKIISKFIHLSHLSFLVLLGHYEIHFVFYKNISPKSNTMENECAGEVSAYISLQQQINEHVPS